MKKSVSIAVVAAVLVAAVFGIGSLASQAKLGVSNPLAAAGGLARVVVLDVEHVEVQDYPKVVIAQPGASLEEYMANEGYTELEEERMGSIRVFAVGSNGDSLNYVEHTVNDHYQLWVWRE